MEILTARQKKAEELKRLTDLASQMAEMQLAELRAEIKVSSQQPQPGSQALSPEHETRPHHVCVTPIELLYGPSISHPTPFHKADIENRRLKSLLIAVIQ